MTTLRWSFDFQAPIDDVWRVMSDTDAFNRRAGFGFRFERVGGELKGQVRVGGIHTSWRELPFEVVAPVRFRSRREYDSGPVATATTTCQLAEHRDGTSMSYEVELVPSSTLSAMIVPAVARLNVKPTLDRALAHVREVLAGRAPWDPPPPLTPAAAALLEEGLARVPGPVAAVLRDRLLRTPRATQDRLRPVQLAAQSGLSLEDVAAGCLDAVDAGLLSLAYALLCPGCRAPKDEAPELSLELRTVHCEACGLTWSGSVADEVEVLFRVAPRIRPEPAAVDCILSPAFTPHLLAQLDLKAGGDVELEVKLERGAYRLERDTGAGDIAVVLVEVLPGGPSHAVVQVDRDRMRPRQLTVGPGRVTLRVRSTADRVMHLALKSRWRPPFVLTAPTFLGLPAIRARTARLRLGPGLSPHVEDGWVVMVVGEQVMLDSLAGVLGPTIVVRRSPDSLVIVVRDAGAALDRTEDVVRWARPVSVGLTHGVVTFLRHASGRVTVGGAPIDRALDLSLRLGVPRVSVDADLWASAEFLEALAERSSRVKGSPASAVLVFGSMLDFQTPARPPSRPPSETPIVRVQPVVEVPAPPASATAAVVTVPERVGPYVVLRELGRGGMGRVYEGLAADGSMVAVKVLNEPVADRQERLVQRFFNEGWYASRLKHPNIVTFVDFGLEEERPWIAMECLVGRTLASELRVHGALHFTRAAALLRPICDALQVLHGQGLVHRDLKPANVFLVDDARVPGGVKLLDFGLVRRSGAHRTDGLAGTPDYISPEQLVGDPLGPAADVYAIGVLAYRMVVGRLPFSGTVGERVISRVGLDPETLPSLDELGPLRPAVMGALTEDPAKRIETAGALREALDGAFR
jgi:hypothetical protein